MDLIFRFVRHFIPISLVAGFGIFSITALGGSDQSRIKGFGVNLAGSMPVSAETSESLLSNIQSAGANYVRIELDWREIETTADTYDWNQNKPLDLMVNSAFSREMNIVAVLTGGPVYLARERQPHRPGILW